MSAHFTREQTVFLPSDDHISRRVGAVRLDAGESWLARAARGGLARLRGTLHRRAVLRELNALSDRELADIGLARGDSSPEQLRKAGADAVVADLQEFLRVP